MTLSPPTTLDRESADRLSAEFHRCFSDFEARADLFAPDTFFDLLPPMWRFQFEGPGAAFTTQLRSIAEGPVEIDGGPDGPHQLGLRDGTRRNATHGPRTCHGSADPPLRGAERSDLRGDDLLQRWVGRRPPYSPCRRGSDGPALTGRSRPESLRERTPSDDCSVVPKLHRHRCRELPALFRPRDRDTRVGGAARALPAYMPATEFWMSRAAPASSPGSHPSRSGPTDR